MRKVILPILSAVVVLSVFVGCNKNGVFSTKKEINLVTQQDSFSYVIGRDIARSAQMFQKELKKEVLVAAILEGFDTMSVSRIDDNTARQIQQNVFERLRDETEAKAKADAEKNDAINAEFFEKNKQREGVVTTESGLQYEVLVEGDITKAKPTDESRVEVRYVGTFIDGKEFDKSNDSSTVKFPVNGVIKGWTEGLKLMNVGSKHKLYIPSDLAYGNRGIPGAIPPASALIFEVELISVE
ncbi:MAG: FKBP-type peptidyl-prolyl cis-trans isomerase [Chitinispirillales bacterium]|jgi:FKBP-type peptidyl-prolyl cis-trans isomerase|nr:FKBP-type peptidyl-prolyl cis-trans isomerase [Chitinispirillales bacterium]